MSSSPTAANALSIEILACNTSIDITHQMGEVTNAYPVIRNPGNMNFSNVCATLSASDEARVHPDKTHCVTSLPAGYQVTLRLTVDTGFRQDTSIQVNVTTQEEISAVISKNSCRDIGLPVGVPDDLGIIRPIN